MLIALRQQQLLLQAPDRFHDCLSLFNRHRLALSLVVDLYASSLLLSARVAIPLDAFFPKRRKLVQDFDGRQQPVDVLVECGSDVLLVISVGEK